MYTVNNGFYYVDTFHGRSSHRLYTVGFHNFLTGQVVNRSVGSTRELDHVAVYEYFHVVGSYAGNTRFAVLVVTFG